MGVNTTEFETFEQQFQELVAEFQSLSVSFLKHLNLRYYNFNLRKNYILKMSSFMAEIPLIRAEIIQLDIRESSA